jgi:apolipoprotein N-acyltransferase
MPQNSGPPQNSRVPLVVDLDGTLVKTDLMWESLARLFRRNPLSIFQILFWWTRGRAFLKQQLARRVKIDSVPLPYHEKFLAWLREQKSAGRKIVLATASDLQMALPVANHVGIFDEVLASDGKTNLRSEKKLKLLVEKFGERGFDYAGNSSVDLAVWRGAREAIVVNASRSVQLRAANCAKVAANFSEDYSPLEIPGRFLNELFWRSGYLVAAFAGLLLAAAFQKIGIAGFAWIAPALLIFSAHKKNSGDAFRAGYVGGISFWLASLYWLLLMPAPGYSILAWIALSAFLALFFAVWTWLLAGKIGEGNWARRNCWSLLGAAVWVALEMFRARIFSGFPWSFLGVSQFQLTPLIQIASITGVYGISFLVIWVSLSFFSAMRMILQKPNLRFAWQTEITLPLFVVAGIFACGEVKLRQQNPPASTLRVTLIQPSVPQTLIWDETENSNRFRELLALSQAALTNKTDLLLWPESAVPELNDENYIAITNFIRAHHVWLIFNADDVLPKKYPTPNDKYDYFNAAFFFDPDGLCAGIYHKQNLVVFGEYIPLVRWLPFVKWFTPITGGYESGKFPVQFEMENLKVKTSPLICFEGTFPRVARKSVQSDTDFLVNLTNDGWFGDSAEQWQHMANSIFRCVENNVPLVRCCNNGVTCWIDASGRVREIFRDKTGSVYGAGAMTIDLPVQNHAQTFYNRHGDWFGWMCVGIASVLLVIKIFPRRRQL